MKIKVNQLFFKRLFFTVVKIWFFVVFFQLSKAQAEGETLCGKIETANQGSYIVMNNRWGTDAAICIRVNSNGFTIIQQSGVASFNAAPLSYPAIYDGCHYTKCSPQTKLPMKLVDISKAVALVKATYPSSGVYDAAFDIWLNPNTNTSGVQATEIMIWLNHTGSIKPLGSEASQTFTAAGNTWKVFVGNNSTNNVVSYMAENITDNFNADIKPFLMDAITRSPGFGEPSWYLTSVQMGFEPWQGGVGLSIDAFSLDFNNSSPNSGGSSGNNGGGSSANNSGQSTGNNTPSKVSFDTNNSCVLKTSIPSKFTSNPKIVTDFNTIYALDQKICFDNLDSNSAKLATDQNERKKALLKLTQDLKAFNINFNPFQCQMLLSGNGDSHANEITQFFSASINKIPLLPNDNAVRQCWDKVRANYISINKIDEQTMKMMKTELTACKYGDKFKTIDYASSTAPNHMSDITKIYSDYINAIPLSSGGNAMKDCMENIRIKYTLMNKIDAQSINTMKSELGACKKP